MGHSTYQNLAKTINQVLSREAITEKNIKSVLRKAKKIRAQYGMMGLWQFSSRLPTHFFTETEMKQLKNSAHWKYFSSQMIQLLIQEQVITPLEAQMVKRYF